MYTFAKITAVLLLCWTFVGCGGGDELAPDANPDAAESSPATPLPQAEPKTASDSSDETAVPSPTLPLLPLPSSASAADADVLFVSATETTNGLWTFSVEVAHPDTGWEDYADGWDVVLPNGDVAKANAGDPFTRLLLHPHENEQPFTRSQSNISIPPEIISVTVRAHDLVHGFGGQEVIVDLTAVSGKNFEVTRLDP